MLHVSSPLDAFVLKTRLLLQARQSLGREFCAELACSMRPLLRSTRWIPAALIVPDLQGYRREVLYEEQGGSFTVGCLTWAPGQMTPIHDHRAWGVVGIVQGALRAEAFVQRENGRLAKSGPDELLCAGDATWVDPQDPNFHDIHRLRSTSSAVTISIHVYGCSLDAINRELYKEDR